MILQVLTVLCSLLLQPPGPAAPPKSEPLKAKTDSNTITVTRMVSQAEAKRDAEALAVELMLARHPDVRVAQARLDEAVAALAQARLKVAIEVTTNQAKLDQAKADVAAKTVAFERVEKLKAARTVSEEEFSQCLAALHAAKAQLATLEKLNGIASSTLLKWTAAPSNAFNTWTVGPRLSTDYRVLPAGDSAQQAQPLRQLLDRKVKLTVGPREAGPTGGNAVLERCVKEWDFAAAKVIVRFHPHIAFEMAPVDAEHSIGVWLLLMLDDMNGMSNRGKVQFYVREYGLLLTEVKNAPDGAPTLAEFLRMPAAK